MSDIPEWEMWDDIQPGEICNWKGCNEPARYISPSYPTRLGGETYIVRGGKWCEAHRQT